MLSMCEKEESKWKSIIWNCQMSTGQQAVPYPSLKVAHGTIYEYSLDTTISENETDGELQS